jgi:hypothetical protein
LDRGLIFSPPRYDAVPEVDGVEEIIEETTEEIADD